MPPIDQPLAILARCGVKMHLRRVLPHPRGQHMLRLFDGHAVHMVDLLANGVIPQPMRLPRMGKIIPGEIQALRHHQIAGRHGGAQLRHHRLGCCYIHVALAHHDPAHVAQYRLAQLVLPRGAHPDDARLAVGVLLDPDHLRARHQRVSQMHGLQEPPLRIAQIGHRVQRHIRHRFAKHRVKADQIIQRGLMQPAIARKLVRRIKRMPRRVERVIHRPLAARQGPWHPVLDHLAHGIVFKEPPRARLRHQCAPSLVSGV